MKKYKIVLNEMMRMRLRLRLSGVGGGGVGVRQARGPLTLSSRLPLATDLMLCLGIPDLLQHVVGSIVNTARIPS